MNGLSLSAPHAPAVRSARQLLSGAATVLFVVGLVALSFAIYPLDRAVVVAFVASVLVVLSIIDIERGIIPNRVVLPAASLVLVAQIAFFPNRSLEWVVAAVAATIALLIPHLIKPDSMGVGDAKLALLLGAALGWGALGALMLAFLCVFPVALVVLLRNGIGARATTLPFGPFLALGALIVLFVPHLAGLPAS